MKAAIQRMAEDDCAAAAIKREAAHKLLMEVAVSNDNMLLRKAEDRKADVAANAAIAAYVKQKEAREQVLIKLSYKVRHVSYSKSS
jgi:hypothetical protein